MPISVPSASKCRRVSRVSYWQEAEARDRQINASTSFFMAEQMGRDCGCAQCKKLQRTANDFEDRGGDCGGLGGETAAGDTIHSHRGQCWQERGARNDQLETSTSCYTAEPTGVIVDLR